MSFLQWEVVTSKGAVIRSFEDRSRAIAFAEANRTAWPGIKVERVEYPAPVRSVVWTERGLRLVANG